MSPRHFTELESADLLVEGPDDRLCQLVRVGLRASTGPSQPVRQSVSGPLSFAARASDQ
jgi:hypothetical protein